MELWFGAAAAVYIAAAVLIRIYDGSGWLWIVTVLISAAALAITLYPLFSILPLARDIKLRFHFADIFAAFPLMIISSGTRKKVLRHTLFLPPHLKAETICSSMFICPPQKMTITARV